jgi:Raf kinase inhibitor-like YbhB/YbcL family protein
MRDPSLWLFFCALAWGLVACAADAVKAPASITLMSPAFQQGQPIPVVHTCDGQDRSPALAWSGLPAGTRSLVLLCDDPDAPVGTWVHWVLYDMAPDQTGLAEGAGAGAAGGGVQGRNSWKRTGYGGPCPPPGKPHRYFFVLYALDAKVNLPEGATQAQVEAAMKGHVIGRGELMGVYGR